MAYLITTTGTQDPVVFDDLGARSFAHPTVDYDLELEFSPVEISSSASVSAAITAGYITVTDGNGVPIGADNGPVTKQELDNFVASAYAESSALSSTTSATPQQKLRLTFTPPAAGDYMLMWSAQLGAAISKDVYAEIEQDDTTIIVDETIAGNGAGYSNSFVGMKRITFADTNAHTFDINYSAPNGGTAYIEHVVINIQTYLG